MNMQTIFLPRHARRALLLLAALALACGSLPAGAQQNPKMMTKTLNSSGAHKECMALTPGQNLRYWFRSDGPVNFNIQYQEGGEVVYPVKHEKISILSGLFMPKRPNDYCIVWTNLSNNAVTLSFEFARLSP